MQKWEKGSCKFSRFVIVLDNEIEFATQASQKSNKLALNPAQNCMTIVWNMPTWKIIQGAHFVVMLAN